MKRVTVFNFTGVYERMYSERSIAGGQRPAPGCLTEWVDLMDLRGTDGYLDDDAAAELRRRIAGIRLRREMRRLDTSVTMNEDPFEIRLLDNGNHHYMSSLLMENIRKDFVLLLVDHHPDIMPPRFGGMLSCGGWVFNSLVTMKRLKRVIIAGADEGLYAEAMSELKDALPGRDLEELTGRVSFIPERILSIKMLTEALAEATRGGELPVYISVDKDILSKEEVDTTWDQGTMGLDDLTSLLSAVIGSYRVIALDICGEPGASAADEAIVRSAEVNAALAGCR